MNTFICKPLQRCFYLHPILHKPISAFYGILGWKKLAWEILISHFFIILGSAFIILWSNLLLMDPMTKCCKASVAFIKPLANWWHCCSWLSHFVFEQGAQLEMGQQDVYSGLIIFFLCHACLLLFGNNGKLSVLLLFPLSCQWQNFLCKLAMSRLLLLQLGIICHKVSLLPLEQLTNMIWRLMIKGWFLCTLQFIKMGHWGEYM
jgi:hypothetical protein